MIWKLFFDKQQKYYYNKCFNYINSIINLDNNYKYYIIDNIIYYKNKNVRICTLIYKK